MESWELFHHGADIGVRGYADNKQRAFEQVAYALTAVMTDPASVHGDEAVDIACEAPDDALLLYDWLNELVYEMATRRLLFGCYAVTIDGSRLAGRAWGEPVDIARHEPAVEIKGATLTALKVECDRDGRWVAQCVVDV